MGLFTSSKKKDCKTACKTDCNNNCKTYCKKSTEDGNHAVQKLNELNKEIEKLKKELLLTQHDADKSNTNRLLEEIRRSHENKSNKNDNEKVEKHFHISGGSRKYTGARKRKFTKKRRSRGGFFFTSKPKINLDECIGDCKKTCGDSCDKICESGSIHADSKVKAEIHEKEKIIEDLKTSIRLLRRVSR
jgi:hypothetical protein